MMLSAVQVFESVNDLKDEIPEPCSLSRPRAHV